ncbi:MAG: hypothetical protein GXY79_08150, partial [Chloroflexi bacterium]|nr:hypothetical protein [Chloroflexota bacterium]
LHAETLYVRVLALDEFEERAHRGVMWCRARLGDLAGAGRQFRECNRITSSELGVSPQPDTLRLNALIQEGEVPVKPI